MAYSSLNIPIPLDYAAQILGINPAHFNCAVAEPNFGLCGPGCSGLWGEWPWQQDTGFSRESLARSLAGARLDVERYLGMPVAPRLKSTWVRYTADCGTDLPVYVGEHLQNYVPYVATELATVTAAADGIEFVDSDTDGFDETVTVTFPCDDAIDPASLVLYANGQFGKPAARIHPFVDAAVVDGEAVITLDVWQLIRPELLIGKRTGQSMVINLADPLSFLDEVTVGYMKATWAETPPARIILQEPEVTCGLGTCVACTGGSLDAAYTSDGDKILVYPAEWNADTETWDRVAWPTCSLSKVAAVEARIYQSYSPATPRSEVSEEIAEIISVLAASRMRYHKCDCTCSEGMAWFEFSTDMAKTSGEGRYVTADLLNCPFGTRMGEQLAWNRLRSMAGLVVGRGSY